jgi:hypothetical protein
MLDTAMVAASPMVIDRLMPAYDATRIEHLVVPGEIETVYAATCEADFLEAWRGSPAVRFLFAARGVGERAVALARHRAAETPPEPDRLRLTDMTTRGDWVLLGEDPPHEIAFGVIGRFWAGETSWEQIDASDFETYDQPGRARIACNFSLRRYGAGHTLVSYECRTKGTDAESTSGFLRYWRALSPFIGVVLRAQLRVISKQAQR